MQNLTPAPNPKNSLAHCLGSPQLRRLAIGLVGVSLLSGCVDDPRSTQISAEEFRTNFAAYAGQKVGFEAYYSKERLGVRVDQGVTNAVFRYDFFSDPERSLRVASFSSTQDTVRDKVAVTIPISTNVNKNVTIDWDKLTFSGVDDVTRPVNPNTVDRQLEALQRKDSAPLLEKGGTIR